MNIDNLEIKPIRLDEWLPDRCLVWDEPFDPSANEPQAGCSSLDRFCTHGDRNKLESIYKEAINCFGGCGFIVWERSKVVAYHTFFPRQMAQRIKFFGWGTEEDTSSYAIVHNCVTSIRGPYRRKGIGSSLIKHSLKWCQEQGWKRFEAHLVLPDCAEGWKGEQKSCKTFWVKLGFTVFRTEEADEETKSFYGVDKRYSMFIDL
jgi:GNAT superfamily N-acetyltransferase